MGAIIPAVAVGVALGDELPKFFDDAFDQIGAGEGRYLRDGNPSSTIVQIGQAIGRAYCRAYDATEASYPPGKGERIEKACRPYLDSIGSPGGPGIALPFRGGQCLCSIYSVRIDVTYTREGSSPPETINGFLLRRVRGPVVGGSVSVTDENRPIFTFTANSVSDNNTTTPACRAAGTTQTRNFATSQAAVEPGSLSSPVLTVTLVSGPDDCGNPTPEPTNTDPVPDPTPPPFRFNPGPDIDIEIDVEIGPDGDIIFDIGTGPITVDPFPDGDGGDGGDGGQPPGDVGSPGPPSNTGEGGETGGDAPPGQVLVGIRVEITEFPPSRNKYTDEVFRGAYYAYMGVPGLLDHDPAGAMATSDQFIFAEKENLTSWRVRANQGYATQVTPYYREV